jgi:hypothetical protein
MDVSSPKDAFRSACTVFLSCLIIGRKNALRNYVYHLYERHSYLRVSVLLLGFIVVLRYAYSWGMGDNNKLLFPQHFG